MNSSRKSFGGFVWKILSISQVHYDTDSKDARQTAAWPTTYELYHMDTLPYATQTLACLQNSNPRFCFNTRIRNQLRNSVLYSKSYSTQKTPLNFRVWRDQGAGGLAPSGCFILLAHYLFVSFAEKSSLFGRFRRFSLTATVSYQVHFSRTWNARHPFRGRNLV